MYELQTRKQLWEAFFFFLFYPLTGRHLEELKLLSLQCYFNLFGFLLVSTFLHYLCESNQSYGWSISRFRSLVLESYPAILFYFVLSRCHLYLFMDHVILYLIFIEWLCMYLDIFILAYWSLYNRVVFIWLKNFYSRHFIHPFCSGWLQTLHSSEKRADYDRVTINSFPNIPQIKKSSAVVISVFMQ